MVYHLQLIGQTSQSLTATSGTVNLGACKKANVQAVLDGHGSYHVAVKPSASSTATCSKGSCAAVLSNLGTYEANLGANTHYLAYRVYNGATGATAAATDKLAIEKLG
jgi:hypothetical protein